MSTKRKNVLLIIILLLTQPVISFAQKFTLVGKVVDQDMNPIEFASVDVASQGKITMTSTKGEFKLELLSADTVAVRFSMVGYKSKTRILRRPRGKQTLQVVMHAENALQEVEVTGQKIQSGQSQELRVKDMKNSPSASGNAVEDLLQTQAGVSTHSELSSQYNVRGGSFNENSVYINQIEVYRPFLARSGQQEGLSIINPYMVDKIAFSTGGFEAKYGDKMSSALDITYKQLKPANGRRAVWEGSLAASMLGGDLYAGYGGKKFSWLNSLRYKTNKYLLGSLETSGEYNPRFLDYQTYLSYRPDERWAVDIIGNISDNVYRFTPKDRETSFGTLHDVKNFRVYFDGHEKDRFLTYFGAITFTRQFNKNTSLSLIGSGFKSHERERYDIQGQYWLNETGNTENLGVGTFFQHARNYLDVRALTAKLVFKRKTRSHNIEAGITLKKEHVAEQSGEYEMRDSAGYSVPHTGRDLNMMYTLRASNTLDGNRSETYLQDTYRFASASGNTHYTLNYGIRLSHWNFNKETIVSPRASLGIIPAFNENVTIRLAAGLYYQSPLFRELRDTTTIDGTTYASLNRKIKSQRSLHFIAAYDYRFKMSKRNFMFSAEAYYKALSNLVPYSVNNVKIVYYGDNLATGHSAGIDLKLYGEFVPGTDSWVSLSLMDTKMNLNGRSVPLPTDQRYGINMFFTDYFPGTDRWKMSLKMAFIDGLPFSTPHRELETNSFRAPAYKRVDIGMSYELFNRKRSEKKNFFKDIWLGIDCLNLFGISNVNSYYWISDIENNQYAVPNYLTGRRINARILFDF